MSAPPVTTVRRSYRMHGVNVEVLTDDPAVMQAMDFRFRRFGGSHRDVAPALRFEFVSVDAAEALPAAGRPVYDTRFGSLQYFTDEHLLAGALGGVTLRCDPARGRALITAPAFEAERLYFATHPVASVALMELMERQERFSLHAACLSDSDGNGLLLSGPSGAGKSTLTLALARAGMEFLGDDIVFLRHALGGRERVEALGFADAMGLGSFAASRFPEFAALAGEPPAEGFPKRLRRFEELFSREPVTSCWPTVIVFPEVAAELPSAVTEIDRGEALMRLVPDVLVTQEAATRSHIAAIADLLKQVRCYAVQSGNDLERAAEITRALL